MTDRYELFKERAKEIANKIDFDFFRKRGVV